MDLFALVLANALWLAVEVSAHLVCVALDWDAEGPAQAQVGDLEAHGAVVDQQVLRLEVAVQHAVLVAVRQALDELVQEVLRAARECARSG